MEEGETMEEGVIRELREELNIGVEKVIRLGIEKDKKGEEKGRFWARMDDEKVKMVTLGDEGQRWEFMSLEEIVAADFVPPLKDFVSRNLEYFKQVVKKRREPDPEKISLKTAP